MGRGLGRAPPPGHRGPRVRPRHPRGHAARRERGHGRVRPAPHGGERRRGVAASRPRPRHGARPRSEPGGGVRADPHVHVPREDKVAQAVSRARAEQSGLWHRRADGTVLGGVARPRPVAYDGTRIGARVAGLDADEAARRAVFAERGIGPLRLLYEDVAARPRAALGSVLAALGLDPGAASAVPVGTARLADARSRRARQFRQKATRVPDCRDERTGRSCPVPHVRGRPAVCRPGAPDAGHLGAGLVGAERTALGHAAAVGRAPCPAQDGFVRQGPSFDDPAVRRP